MATIFLIHGSFGNPTENWFPWLQKSLENEGHRVIVPTFPTQKNQSLNSWRQIFSVYEDEITSDTIFVGHSLGPAFILDILERRSIPIKACFFVSGFLGLLGNETFDSVNNTFTTKQFDFDKIRANCHQFILFHGNNDPYVPIEKAHELENKLGAKLHVVLGAGHFNEESKYLQFPKLLESIKLVLNI